MRVVVYGLWHLGSVTAACMAEAGFEVVGLDPDPAVVTGLRDGRAPLMEPGLDALIRSGLDAGRLSFETEPRRALAGADVLWVTFDTPVDEDDEAKPEQVRAHLDAARDAVPAGTLVIVSSQVPVGFCRTLATDWAGRGLAFACSPENLRLGRALEVFRRPERVVVGLENEADRTRVGDLFRPFCENLIVMSLESAEMTKHAINAFLATSVAFTNELARLCEASGANSREVERGLRSEPRIGKGAYVSPGAPFAGGTLGRDVRFLGALGRREAVATSLLQGVVQSNGEHGRWLLDRVRGTLAGVENPKVSLLGLVYKPDTSTLRRSGAVELARALHEAGAEVRGYDPAIAGHQPELDGLVQVFSTVSEALQQAHVAVVTTPWAEFRSLSATEFKALVRRPVVVDPSWHLAATLGADPEIEYIAPGLPGRRR